VVPPVPKRKLALLAALAVAVSGAAAALIAPRIEQGKQRAAQRERRERAAVIRAEERRLAEDQHPHSARGEPVPAAATPAAEKRARRLLRRDLERSITRDGRARVADGKLDGPIRRTVCQPVAGEERDLERRGGLYQCFVVRREGRTPMGVGVLHGYPFVARIDYRTGSYTWCKTNPQPGEKAGHSIARVRLSRSCAGRLAEVL
jgi:hypothetical protein